MSPETRRKLINLLVRLHFAYLILAPLLGLISWWVIDRKAMMLMVAASFAAIAAYYSLQVERYHVTSHLPSLLLVVFLSPTLLLVSSLTGGGFWSFYVNAAFVEVGGMCGGIVIAATLKGLKEKEYFFMGVLYLFMGGFLVVWSYKLFPLHARFPWYESIGFLAAFANQTYWYGRMFTTGELDLAYGHGSRAQAAGAELLPGPLKDDQGMVLILIFAVAVVLSPFVIGLLSYVFKL